MGKRRRRGNFGRGRRYQSKLLTDINYDRTRKRKFRFESKDKNCRIRRN